jgi:hypothetical protein
MRTPVLPKPAEFTSVLPMERMLHEYSCQQASEDSLPRFAEDKLANRGAKVLRVKRRDHAESDSIVVLSGMRAVTRAGRSHLHDSKATI